MYFFAYDPNDDMIGVAIMDAYTYSSLLLHMGASFEREKDEETEFGNTRIFINFLFLFWKTEKKYMKKQRESNVK